MQKKHLIAGLLLFVSLLSKAHPVTDRQNPAVFDYNQIATQADLIPDEPTPDAIANQKKRIFLFIEWCMKIAWIHDINTSTDRISSKRFSPDSNLKAKELKKKTFMHFCLLKNQKIIIILNAWQSHKLDSLKKGGTYGKSGYPATSISHPAS